MFIFLYIISLECYLQGVSSDFRANKKRSGLLLKGFKQVEIVKLTGISKGYVSKIAKKMKEQ